MSFDAASSPSCHVCFDAVGPLCPSCLGAKLKLRQSEPPPVLAEQADSLQDFSLDRHDPR